MADANPETSFHTPYIIYTLSINKPTRVIVEFSCACNVKFLRDEIIMHVYNYIIHACMCEALLGVDVAKDLFSNLLSKER